MELQSSKKLPMQLHIQSWVKGIILCPKLPNNALFAMIWCFQEAYSNKFKLMAIHSCGTEFSCLDFCILEYANTLSTWRIVCVSVCVFHTSKNLHMRSL